MLAMVGATIFTIASCYSKNDGVYVYGEL